MKGVRIVRVVAVAIGVLGLVLAAQLVGDGQERPYEPVGTPKDKQTIVENLPGQVGSLFKWPDLKTIPAEKIMKGTENMHTSRARGVTVPWIKEIIADRYLPEDQNDLQAGMVMVKDEYDLIDATHVEWVKHGWRFQVTQSRTVFTVMITPVAEGQVVSGNTLAEKVVSAARVCATSIRDLSKVEGHVQPINIAPQGTMSILRAKTFDQGRLKECTDGLVGQPAKPNRQEEYDRRRYGYWWRRVGWWTNGRTLGLYTFKIKGGAWKATYGPGRDSWWFEDQPKKTNAKTSTQSD